MTKRKLLLGASGLAVVIGAVVGLVFWINNVEEQEPLPDGIIGTWKFQKTGKPDRVVTFSESGDFKFSVKLETIDKHRAVTVRGSWILRERTIQLDNMRGDMELGWRSWQIVSVTKQRLVLQQEGHQLVFLREPEKHHEKALEPETRPSFSGKSDALTRTLIVPTLQTPLQAGKSAIWSAALSLAWQGLEKEVAKAPLELTGAEEIARDLRQTPDVALLAKHYYVAAGFLDAGIVERIRREFPARFPTATLRLPEPPLPLEGALAVSYIETTVRYQFEFNDIDKPMQFKDSQGAKAAVKAFGIREADTRNGIGTYRSQVEVLFRDGSDFAIDLSRRTRPYQIIVARMPRDATLQETLATLERRKGEALAKKQDPNLGDGAILGVPHMHWHIDHRFKEMEGMRINGGAVPSDAVLSWAFQFVKFKIDRRGAEVDSGSSVMPSWNGDHPDDYRLDRPYLIVLKNRDSRHPFFVMWVDNAELMQTR